MYLLFISWSIFFGAFIISQVYMHGNEAPRCLHQWSPHDGMALSSLFFLDNHLDYNPEEQFWKYAVTGTNQCRCKSWNA